MWAVEKQYYEMPELVGFQTMVILDPNGMTFDAEGVFGLVFWLLFKSGSSYCGLLFLLEYLSPLKNKQISSEFFTNGVRISIRKAAEFENCYIIFKDMLIFD